MRGAQKIIIPSRASTRVIVSRDSKPLTAMELHQAAEQVLAEARMIRKGEKGGR